MKATLIDGRAIADKICSGVRSEIDQHVSANRRRPKLVAILVGDDGPSHLYVKRKHQTCERVGIETEVVVLPESTAQADLHGTIERLNSDPKVDGILLQLPLPEHLDTKSAISQIATAKDVDGLTPHHQGCLQWRFDSIYPCTAIAVLHMIKEIIPEISGKLAAIVGLSPLAGAPISALLSQERATTINIHRRTKNPAQLCSMADIIVSCTGVKGLIAADWVKEGAVIIDVGIYREGKKIFGDVDFEGAKDKAGYLTPVPGGVGPVTIAMLAQNTLDLYRTREGL